MVAVKANNPEKRWLVVSYFSSIPGACQAEWIDDRMAAMVGQGIAVELISSFCGTKHKEIRTTRACSLSPSEIMYELEFVLARHSKGVGRILTKAARAVLWPLKLIEDKWLKIYGEGKWGWAPLAALFTLFAILRRKPTLIFSTGGPASAHLAAYIAAKLCRLPWMAELQDPLVGEDIGRNAFSQRALRAFEGFLFRHADRVIYCTKTACEQAEKRHAYPGKGVAIYPGSSVVKAKKKATSATFTIRYLGSLYSTRNLDQIMAAIKTIYVDHPEFKRQLRLETYGHSAPDIRERIMTSGIAEISMTALIPRQKVLEIASDSAVLLLVQNTDMRSVSTIPFKTYDYLNLGVPILGLIYRNRELSDLLQSHGHTTVQADDSADIAKALLEIWQAWQSGQLSAKVKDSALTPMAAVKAMVALSQTLSDSATPQARHLLPNPSIEGAQDQRHH